MAFRRSTIPACLIVFSLGLSSCGWLKPPLAPIAPIAPSVSPTPLRRTLEPQLTPGCVPPSISGCYTGRQEPLIPPSGQIRVYVARSAAEVAAWNASGDPGWQTRVDFSKEMLIAYAWAGSGCYPPNVTITQVCYLPDQVTVSVQFTNPDGSPYTATSCCAFFEVSDCVVVPKTCLPVSGTQAIQPKL